MTTENLLVLSRNDVLSLLDGKELELVQAVASAYELHAAGASSLPPSSFLRFPDRPANRIIALPAYLGAEFEVAGIKWISSFPGNLEQGIERASAVIILNSTATGRPEAILEGSIISAKRTAASAALAAQRLHRCDGTPRLGIIGCGVINLEVVRFVLALLPEIGKLSIHDLDAERVEQFRKKCLTIDKKLEIEIANNVAAVLEKSSVTSIATTALAPYISDLSSCPAASTILHVSLRDLTPEAILAGDNVVDDLDHVCRENTSIHLAAQLTGNRDFVRCTLADILAGRATARRDEESVAVFSPFGLGVLDLAVGKLVVDIARHEARGTTIDSFFS